MGSSWQLKSDSPANRGLTPTLTFAPGHGPVQRLPCLWRFQPRSQHRSTAHCRPYLSSKIRTLILPFLCATNSPLDLSASTTGKTPPQGERRPLASTCLLFIPHSLLSQSVWVPFLTFYRIPSCKKNHQPKLFSLIPGLLRPPTGFWNTISHWKESSVTNCFEQDCKRHTVFLGLSFIIRARRGLDLDTALGPF